MPSWKAYSRKMEGLIFWEIRSPPARGDKFVEELRAKLPRKEE